jgi:hypothetical protein
MEKNPPAQSSINSFSNLIQIFDQNQIKFYKKQNFLEILAKRILNPNEKFIDIQFPPGNESLYGKNLTRDNIETIYEEDMQSLDKQKNWCTTNEIFDSVIISFNNFSIFDIVQGGLSDCYYMSALAALGNYPELILNLFVMLDIEMLKKIAISNDMNKLKDPQIVKQIMIDFTQFGSENHLDFLANLNKFYMENYSLLKCFIMKIRIHGEWKYILLDGYFPTYEGYSSLIFGRSNSNDLWVSLIEKMWAKILGGYYKTSLGAPSEGFLSLTDCPTDVYHHTHYESSEDLWEGIKLARSKKWILACIIQLKSGKTKYFKSIGLITNHCYTIVRLEEVKYLGKTHRFILIRNPHGSSNYSGSYHDGDKQWTEQLKTLVNFYDRDEGCFFMTLDDYFKHFDHTFVCKYEDGYVSKSYKIPKNILLKPVDHGVYFLIKIGSEGRVFFTLHQKYKRVHGKGIKNKIAQILISRVEMKNTNNNNQKNSTNITEKVDSLNLNQCEDVDFQYIAGGNSVKSASIDSYFLPGYYVLYGKMKTGLKSTTGFVLSTYSTNDILNQIEMSLINDDITNNGDKLLKGMLTSLCKTKLPKDSYPNNSEVNLSINCKMNSQSYKLANLNDCNNGFGVIYIENNSDTITINTKLTIKDFTNLEFGPMNQNTKIESQQGGNNLNMNLLLTTAPNSNNLIYFFKQRMKCGFKISFSENFSMQQDHLKSTIKTKGDKKDVLFNGAKSGVSIYSIGHGKGYLFLFENINKKTAVLKIIFTKLENLKNKEIKSGGNYEVTLKPNEQKYLELPAGESNKSISIAYKYAVALK